jgi:hypothetical protein
VREKILVNDDNYWQRNFLKGGYMTERRRRWGENIKMIVVDETL